MTDRHLKPDHTSTERTPLDAHLHCLARTLAAFIATIPIAGLILWALSLVIR